MTDLDQRIASVLRERAEGEIDTHRLLHRSRARGRRRQLRRRVATGTALALVGVLGFVGVTGTDFVGLPGRPPWTAATPAAAAPVPPRADGVPGAAQRPDLVGADPQLLHLGVDPAKGRYLGWEVNETQVESVRFDAGGGQAVTVEVARSATAFDGLGISGWLADSPPEPTFDGSIQRVVLSNGSPGYVTWWQPATGLYARASMRGEDPFALTRAITAVRWDEARRCGGPVRLTHLPEGASVRRCAVDVATFPGAMTASFTIAGPRSAAMYVELRYGAQIAGGRTDGNLTINGRPAHRYGDNLELLGISKAHLIVNFGWPGQGFTEADAATVLVGARVAQDVSRPDTWG
ncbi:hypothetical protein GA0074695_1429 [Micromonospora viridifaciens]|uniref:Uncharacterized protein n=1 Tax=Micromonospora viridifaciens TaxID=1881 RepID=A0A1C4VFN9_MICVI|nr:hypothetical protein [Micromonospora viridifaciens]SCE82817.1 hypothetical protein GA0074695_1429 [Micromonospora viridifaciens]